MLSLIHIYIIIHAQQDVFQIGTGKTVFRNLPDAAVFHIRAEDGGPVSYTHLDVYKRQDIFLYLS